ncbi:ty3-gypsy retrotransposon protein [Cucumis melo var. makuwa]|uniref:Ty3-gypsy retrotransposon protein n=1 Tax=Cucumis melo var. makuwa TaxID=1194695 RepID=A0A5D3BGU7_CUCMM|nr:ty3-gypsy retrotransposon protein [Cucumis melo var. makuwa]
MQEQEQSSVLKKKSWEQLIESPKGGITIIENPLFNNSTPASNLSDKESHLEVVSVMMAAVTAETTMTEMERKINFLMKAVEERDHEIAALKDQMKACETAESSKTPIVKADDKGKAALQVYLCRLLVSPTAARYDHKFRKSSVWRTTTNFFPVLQAIHQENQ